MNRAPVHVECKWVEMFCQQPVQIGNKSLRVHINSIRTRKPAETCCLNICDLCKIPRNESFITKLFRGELLTLVR